jgi:alpha-mannosidase
MAPAEVDGNEEGITISNGLISAKVFWNGTIQSLIDLKTGREMLSGPANELHLLRDYPNRWNAWDIEGSAMEDYEVVGSDVTGKVLEDGPLRVVIQFERKFGKSTVLQKVILRAGSARLDFDTTVDWQERNRVLKVSFPLAIRTEHAVFEIQSGHVRRPVHRNTSWDAARFEVPMQRWVDLSESDHGIALINNGSFGCDVLGGRIRLTLLKSASAPDPTADIGVHHRIFSLFPHAGTTTAGGVIEEALALNVPLVVAPGGLAEESGSWLSFDTPGVTLEALKRSEDGQAVVFRLLEAYGRRTKTALTTSLEGLAFKESDLLEKTLPEAGDTSGLALRAFDLRTFRSV